MPPSPYDSANILSRLTFWWLNKVFYLGYKGNLSFDTLFDLPRNDTTDKSHATFIREWEKEVSKANASRKSGAQDDHFDGSQDGFRDSDKSTKPVYEPSVLKAFWRSFWPLYMQTVFWRISFSAVLLFAIVFLFDRLLKFVENDEPLWNGIGYALGFFFAYLFLGVAHHRLFFLSARLGLRLKAALTASVYQKALKIRSTGIAVGQVTNLISNDAQRLIEASLYFNFTWSALLETIAIFILLIVRLGWEATVPPLAVVMLFFILQYFVGKQIGIIRMSAVKLTDKRVRVMSEILTAIKLVKFYAWESAFAEKVEQVRKEEVGELERSSRFHALNTALGFAGPSLVTVLTLALYVVLVSSGSLDAATAFVTVALINALRFPLLMLVMGIKVTAEGWIALQRIQKFLVKPDMEVYQSVEEESDIALEIKDGEFAWDAGEAGLASGNGPIEMVVGDSADRENPDAANSEPDTSSRLTGIQLSVRRGELLAVVGSVGSGKSSLLSAMIGEIPKISGNVVLRGTCGYVSQQAFVLNQTLRENVLFGEAYDEKKYKETIRVCALEPDLKLLPEGDATQIGERGVNLSGGQKQRVSCARAVYTDRDIILLDDALSAVDAGVGAHIFEQCIMGLLAKKTVVLVTNQLHYLSRCDRVACMVDGRIAELGTFDDLMEAGGAFAELMKEHGEDGGSYDEKDGDDETLALIDRSIRASADGENEEKERENDDKIDKKKNVAIENQSTMADESGSELVLSKSSQAQPFGQAEESDVGAVSASVYGAYLTAAGSGSVAAGVVITVVGSLLYVLTQVSRTMMDWFISFWVDTGRGPADNNYYILWLCILSVSQLGFTLFRTVFHWKVTLKAAETLHNGVFKRILHAPMSFFDISPVGRLLNRFSKDQDFVDSLFPMAIEQAVQGMVLCGTIFVLIPSIFVWFLIPLVLLAALFLGMQYFYLATSRELRRMDGLSRSPIYAALSATLQGLPTIRAYRVQEAFTQQYHRLIDRNHQAFIMSYWGQRWLGFRLDFISDIVVFCTAIFIVVSKGTVEPGLAGLALSYAVQLSQILQWTVRQVALTDSLATSVERLLFYSNIDVEGPWESLPECRPMPRWPSEGAIVFDKVSLRYAPHLPLILNEMSFSIKPREKVGVVGRTGAGKSSIIVALYRMVNCCGGSIVIDGVDVSKIGLEDLRSRLSIIPQDPVLFIGTIRSNLDPFEKHTDEEIWNALRKSNMYDVVQACPAKLEESVSENGSNFSVGQRQLLCLSRAVLRQSQILVLDEASSAIDVSTDALIQETIRESFKDCTVLTIAHRINTLIDSDRVMVLDKGKVAEFDTPFALLNRQGTGKSQMFSDMVDQLGKKASSHLLKMASVSAGMKENIDKKKKDKDV